MAGDRDLADRAAKVALSAPELLAKGFRAYQRYHLKLTGSDGTTIEQTRDVVRGGKVVAVLPVDVERNEIVLVRQFRLPAHLANGRGDLVEIVAGRVEQGEQPAETARRECSEEIGVSPRRLVELFTYLSTPGVTDEEITLFLAAVDASRVFAQTGGDEERIETLRVAVDDAIATLGSSKMRNGPMLIALQWLALNRGRLAGLLAR